MTNCPFEGAVIGAGPAGIAILSQLLLTFPEHSFLWIDPDFEAGRLSHYPEVPSNTKTKYFLDYMEASGLNIASPINIDFFDGLDRERGCDLSLASKMCKEMTGALQRDPRVRSLRKLVDRISYDGNFWKIDGFEARLVFLATGSTPKDPNVCLSGYGLSISPIPLETCLSPTRLSKVVNHSDTVLVIGSSHSAMLAVRNLVNLGISNITQLVTSDYKYAIYMDGWILYDNTGLKGSVADWTREFIDPICKIKNFERINVHGQPERLAHLSRQKFTKCVVAVGFDRDTLPDICINGQIIKKVQYNDNTAQLISCSGPIPNAYGIGIAFPEKVVDPHGNIEHNVGLWKFMNYAREIMQFLKK